jgi:hypothetical protein
MGWHATSVASRKTAAGVVLSAWAEAHAATATVSADSAAARDWPMVVLAALAALVLLILRRGDRP